MASWSNLNTQDANSPVMEQLIMFHDHTMMIIVMITITVLYMMISLMTSKFINRMLLEGQLIELIWTIMPAILLIFIALPSLKILYMIEETNKPLISIKAIGHQWFWSYEYSDFKKIEFDSYMKPTSDLENNEFRLLETDNRVVLPFNTQTRILMTSSDVIHSWTIPCLGLKVDASPGRINQGNILMKRPGLFYGQCSEICGANHSFMPIVLESINMKSFLNWLKNY
uniref:Cytochrome c oxidase subunit 2 n=2 Tax=Empoascanara TaxID=562279 RepID=A0AA51NHH6_9HEMI|nr:cytochrome c oxidase subunit II [Empoascanara alami]YP_010952972.1 cytochrome c oxidase subunit II [Empoascanara hongkongica]WMQ52376.1 cytochrome c oxidase subunit 2 [Empoascanara alami]WMQ52415.1 cytochrome c oxidase subunit 2 [Empoascanara hongkongica]